MTLERQGDYETFLKTLKERIASAQIRAALAVSRELVALYWEMGRDLALEQDGRQWGGKMLRQVARDLSHAFPGVEGLSERNLYRMVRLYRTYPESLPQAVATLPWGHIAVLLQKVQDPEARLWYAQAAFEHGWSRNILEIQIDTRLLERQGTAITNFSKTLPPPQSDLAQQILKDPYNFDFLTLASNHLERELERGLLAHLQTFMLELGVGFAFLGSQYPLEVGGQNFYIDLLFYHVKLHCYVVVELKARDFEPGDAGQMSFYLSAVDGILKSEGDAPTVGILLCKSKNKVVAEYALSGFTSPIGVSEYQFTEALPRDLEGSLPTVEQLEAELARLEGEGSDSDET